MNFQSPPKRRGSLSSDTSTTKDSRKSPTMEMSLNFVGSAESSSLHNSFSSDKQFQLQRQMSVTELDRLQRVKREDAERLNIELQSFSVMDKLKNAKHMQSLPSFGHIEVNYDTMASLPSKNQGYGLDVDDIDDDVGFAFDQDDAPMLRNRFTRKRTKVLAPKLRIRPHRHAFFRKEEPVIIIPGEEDGSDDKFGDLFPSPHSNKFVLQIPDAPTQELTLKTSVEDEYGDDDSDVEAYETNYVDGNFEQVDEEPQRHVLPGTSDFKGIPCPSTGSYFLRPNGSNASLPSQQHLSSIPSSGNSSTSSSPIPVKRAYYRKKKVLLKPKKGRSFSHIEINGGHSPISTSSSSIDGNDNGLDRSIDEMASDLNFNGSANAANSFAPDFNQSAPLQIRPKREQRLSMVTKRLTDECADTVMELDPNMSISKECEKSVDAKTDLSTHQDFTPTRHRYSTSVSFTDDCDFFTRSRSQSSNSMQEQIEMAKKAAARFGGFNKFMSPSNLSESNFRTPNAESTYKRNCLNPDQGNLNADSNNLSVSSSDKKGIYMPKLFSSPFEDDFPIHTAFDGQGTRSRSSSVFSMMKEAFSPPKLPWK